MRRAIVTTSATVSGIVLLLGLKPHGGTAVGQTKSFSIGSSSDSAQSQDQSGGTSGGSSSGGSTSGGSSGGSSSTGGSSSGGSSSGGSDGSSGGSSTPTQSPATTAPKQSFTGAKTVTGEAADTRYGPVQLKVTFSGKKITNIDVVEYPTESGRDVEINSYALPILNQEAMSAQSAQIDAVSGATFTSDGYVQSLQSAIDQLGA